MSRYDGGNVGPRAMSEEGLSNWTSVDFSRPEGQGQEQHCNHQAMEEQALKLESMGQGRKAGLNIANAHS